MDPNECLTELRRLIAAGAKADAINERITALDNWLSNGGFLPDDWSDRKPADCSA